jgi:hypothetical protein
MSRRCRFLILAVLFALAGCRTTIPGSGSLGDTLQAGKLLVHAGALKELDYTTIADRVPASERDQFSRSCILRPGNRILLFGVQYTNQDLEPVKISQGQWKLELTPRAFEAYKPKLAERAAQAAAAGAGPVAKAASPSAVPLGLDSVIAEGGVDSYLFQYCPETRVEPSVRVGAKVTKDSRIAIPNVPADLTPSDLLLVFEDRTSGAVAKFALQ